MSNFFEQGLGRQNGVFGQGMGWMMESAKGGSGAATTQPDEPEKKDEDALLLEAVNRAANEADRGTAAAAVIEWARSGDASYLAFDDYAMAMAGIEDDEDPSDEQVDDYNDFLNLMADAAVALGASEDDVTAMIDDEDDAAAATVMDVVLGMNEDGEAEAITAFSLKSGLMLEAVKKVIRGGKVKLIKKPVRKRRLTGAQRSALKKARMKAHTSAAKVARAKSMKQRRRRGM